MEACCVDPGVGCDLPRQRSDHVVEGGRGGGGGFTIQHFPLPEIMETTESFMEEILTT